MIVSVDMAVKKEIQKGSEIEKDSEREKNQFISNFGKDNQTIMMIPLNLIARGRYISTDCINELHPCLIMKGYIWTLVLVLITCGIIMDTFLCSKKGAIMRRSFF